MRIWEHGDGERKRRLRVCGGRRRKRILFARRARQGDSERRRDDGELFLSGGNTELQDAESVRGNGRHLKGMNRLTHKSTNVRRHFNA